MSSETPAAAAPEQATPNALLLVISGPSGVGKDTVLAGLKERGQPFHYTVTMTTRPPREDEAADGPFLRFASEEEFDRLLAEDGFLEHAQVYGYRYGVPKAPVQEALAGGHDVVVRVDVQGAATIKALAPEALLIFLAPRSIEELEARMRARGGLKDDALARKLEAVAREMEQRSRFDYTVVNEEGHVEEAVDAVLAIVEVARRRGRHGPVRL